MKIKNSIKTLTLSLTLVISSCATTPSFERREPAAGFRDCYEMVTDFFSPKSGDTPLSAGLPLYSKKPGVITESMAKSALRYPDGFTGAKGQNIQYGFESEYLHEETEAFFINYMPHPSLYSGSKEDWLGKTHEERLQWIDTYSKDLFPYRQKGKLVKISSDLELSSALPDSFVYDAGHFEIVLDPMDSAEELIKKIKTINKHFGVGSMQVTISNPLPKDKLANAVYREEAKKEILGYYNFMNEFDTLNKLGTGYERYLENPKAMTVKSFNHPWLGPMTKLKHERLKELLYGIVDQKKFSDEELAKISSRVISHKFIGGLSFRPDVAYKKGRIASEVRDCHQNIKCVEDRIIRETYFLMKGKQDFKTFAQFEAFDSVKSYSYMPSNIKQMLKTLFPTYGNYSQVEMELFRNFSYPMRDWSKHVEVLGAPELKQSIWLAQNEYKETLDKISKDLNASMITKSEAQAKVMGALGQFSKNSGVLDAMKKQYDDLVDPNEIKNFDQLKFALWLRTLWNMA